MSQRFPYLLISGNAKLIITADEGRRGGKSVPLLKIAEEAVKGCPSVERILVQNRSGKFAAKSASQIDLETVRVKQKV